MIHFEIAHEEFIYHNYTLIGINGLPILVKQRK